MEDRGRPFEAVKIGMAAVETCEERFQGDGSGQVPPRAYWRINLTALSQQYDLYFVACAHEIHVYRPHFPYQKLGRKPACVLIPQLANPSAPGYISPRHPHCINHLMLGDLGNQEILLFATDSGNVTAYHTQPIFDAVLENETHGNKDSTSPNYRDIRPFFAQWVEESAWGLSIHTEGRMIAVSANTSASHVPRIGLIEDRASITVFAFALEHEIDTDERDANEMPESSETNGLEPEWYTWNPESLTVGCSYPDRNKNYKIILSGPEGHAANIPSVTFLNYTEDKPGSWLLSTDIDEDVKLWQIWKGNCIRTWRFRDNRATGAAWLGGHERGWAVAALDKKSFQPATNMEAFIGYKKAAMYHGYASPSQGQSFDITIAVRYHVPSNSLFHPAENEITDSDDDNDDNKPRIFEDLTDSESAADETELARMRETRLELEATASADNSIDNTSPSADPRLVDASLQTLQATEFDSDESLEDESEFDVDSNFSVEMTQVEDSIGSSDGSHRNLASSGLNGHNSSTGDENTGSSPLDVLIESTVTAEAAGVNRQPSDSAETLQPQTNQSSYTMVPDVPFIYCSTSHLRLFSSTNQPTPHLFCGRILKQSMGPLVERGWIAQMDRLNMVQQIPELGILIIATQAGRCAVCTLTRRVSDGLVGMRVDWMLPTKKQEKAGLRPNVPLQGIAVGPIQGRQRTESCSGQLRRHIDRLSRNQLIDGVPTVFDKTAVSLSRPQSVEPSSSKRLSASLSPSLGGNTKPVHRIIPAKRTVSTTKPHTWTKGKLAEPWKAIDGSRRYRLMLTYLDCTVLSYEIYRGVERHDTRSD